jgi:type IV pilus assembly protein PilM
MYATLNISNTGIRLLAVAERRVTVWGETTLAPGLVRDGLILQPQAVAEAISTLFKARRIPRTKVITCVTGLVFTYRFLTLPRMKSRFQEEAVWRAARKEIPLPLEDLYLSRQLLANRQGEQDYFVVGVGRNLIDALVQTLEAASIEPYVIDLKSLALARAAHRGETIIASLEPDCFDIVLVAGSVPAILYSVSPRWIGASPEDNARQFLDELSKIVAFYNDNHPRQQLNQTTPLLLTGALSADATLAGIIHNEAPYPVEPLVPPLQFPDDLPVASYAANMGLALKKIPPKTAVKDASTRFRDININILSGKSRPVKTRPVPLKSIIRFAILTLAIIMLLPMYLWRSQSGTESTRLLTELSRIDQENYQSELALKKSNQLETSILSITGETEALEQEQRTILAHRGDFTSNLRHVTGALPARTYITNIEINKTEVTLQGETDNYFQVVKYAQTLESLGIFREVRIVDIDERIIESPQETASGSSQDASYVITFTIKIRK